MSKILACYPNINFNKISTMLPGIPSNPTKIAVIKFSPIWNPKFPPIKFINNINTQPNIELSINLNIYLSGTINNLPTKKITIIPIKYATKIFDSNLNHLYFNTMT